MLPVVYMFDMCALVQSFFIVFLHVEHPQTGDSKLLVGVRDGVGPVME